MAINLLGQKFGDWKVVERAENKNDKAVWVCRCRCGALREVVGASLTRGVSTSCGCRRGSTYTFAGHTAARKRPPGYSSWVQMRQRCNNPHKLHFERYGGRGIRVCERWDKSFADFIADMGEPPTPRHTIERIDNDGHYEPGNCRWATRKEQAQNRHYTSPKTPRLRNASGRFTG